MINLIENYSRDKHKPNKPNKAKQSQSQQAKPNKPTTTRNSKHKMSSNSALTMAVLMKEAIADMPDTLDTKKEVEEYFKTAMKVINEKKKEEEKVKKAAAKAAEKAAKPATKKRGEKKEKEKEVDEEGNEIVKEKKPLSRYMKFMEEHRPKVAANVSGLTPQELFTEVAKLWKTYKDFLSDYNGDDEERKAEIWETKLEELLVKRNEELNADKEEVKEDADEEVAEEKEAAEVAEAAVVVEKKKGGKKKAEEVEDKKEKKPKPAKPVEVAKKPKMKGGKKKADESDVEKKESEDEENSS